MKQLAKTINLFTYSEKKYSIFIVFLVISMAFFEAIGVASVIPFLGVLGDPDIIQRNATLSSIYTFSEVFGVSSEQDFLIILGLLAFISIVISASYRSFTQYSMLRFVEALRHSLSLRLLKNCLRRPYEDLFDRHSGAIVKTVLSETDQLLATVIHPAFQMLASCFVLLSTFLVLILVDPWLAFFAVGVLGGLYLLIYRLLKKKLSFFGASLVKLNNSRYVVATELIGGIKDIKMLGREANYLQRFDRQSKGFAEASAFGGIIKLLPSYLIEAIAFGTIVGLTVVLMLVSDETDGDVLGKILPVLGVYAFAAYRMKPAFQGIYKGVSSLNFGSAVIDSLSSELYGANRFEEVHSNPKTAFQLRNKITLNNVYYQYPSTGQPSLHGLNFTIEAGSTVGVVGSTGAGKTSLVDIFLGLLKPTGGEIFVDNTLINDANRRDWRRSVGYVSQEIFLTDSTIAENIALGVDKASIDFDHVKSCARIAQIHNFIEEELHDGYSTFVGERGVRLSGGQRQRIGVARALYANAEILVFDEATSALDTVTEKALIDEIKRLAGNKTMIVVTHRLGTIKFCDKIILLQRGRIIGEGKYHELEKNNDTFREFISGSPNFKSSGAQNIN